MAGIIVLLETSAVVQESTSVYSHSSGNCTGVILFSACLSFNLDPSLWTKGKSFQKPDGKQAPCDTVRHIWLFLLTAGTWCCSDAGNHCVQSSQSGFFHSMCSLIHNFMLWYLIYLVCVEGTYWTLYAQKNTPNFTRGPSSMQLLWVFFPHSIISGVD